jgi:hypothetical protein
MPQTSLFEHERISYDSLGWDAEAPYPDLLLELNQACGTTLVQVER